MTYLDKLRDLLPWKRKGYEVLGKYDTSNPQVGDGQVLAAMLERGADLAKERHVVHYLYFKTDDTRATVEMQLRSEGYETRHGVDYGDVRPKSLIAERHGLVNDTVIDGERQYFTDLVLAVDGDYDGWEAALD
jgi:hypothetical protein